MRRPFWWIVTLWLITPVAALALALASPNDRSVAIAGLIFGPMAAAFLAYLTDGWRPVKPSLGDATAQKLIEKAVATFMDQDKAAIARWMENGSVNKDAVNQKVIAIIANCSDLKPDAIKSEHRFVKDLGLD
jgi:hypothetical protein